MLAIAAQNVRKVFGTFEAVKDVSFTVNAGECFGLLGPNGAGKSTLINLLYGALDRTSGRLEVLEQDPAKAARNIKRRLGVVTQENALDESLSVIENMMVYSAFVNVPKAERKTRIMTLLEFMSLAHKAGDPILHLSGGMKRRLVFVRALLSNPDLIILDEPTTGLDPAVRHLLWGKIQDLKRQGKTILLTTHYMHEAEVLCDRLVIMNKGSVIAHGTPAQLRLQHVPGFVAMFGKERDLAPLKTLTSDLRYGYFEDSSGAYVRAPGLNDLIEVQKKSGLEALQMRPSNLEDVFLKLTGQELTADA